MIVQISLYLEPAFGDLDQLAEAVSQVIPTNVEYDTLVGTGLSGALVIPHLAHVFKKFFLIVRKDGDSVHATHRAEGRLGSRWIFVDDVFASGATRERVKQAVRGISTDTRYVGDLLYDFAPTFRLGSSRFGCLLPENLPADEGAHAGRWGHRSPQGDLRGERRASSQHHVVAERRVAPDVKPEDLSLDARFLTSWTCCVAVSQRR